MKNLLILLFLLISSTAFSCHYSYLTLNGGPTAIGGGLYSTDVTVCIEQKQNWGGTDNFTLCFDVPISSASGPNFPTVTNTYNICGGPCGPTQSVTASATGTIAGNCITYNTTTSTPAGYPLVPDRYDGGAGAAGNSNSFCFTITIVTNGYPGSLALAGNVEAEPGVSGNDGNNNPCQGNGYEPDMTIAFAVLPIELIEFGGYNEDEVNNLYWITASEINNDYYIVENSINGYDWELVGTMRGAGNSNTGLVYDFDHIDYKDSLNYYRLTQVDFDGARETFRTIVIDNKVEAKVLIRTVNLMGQEVDENYKGIKALIYSDNSVRKVITQ